MPVADTKNPRGMTPARDVRRSRGEDPYPSRAHRRNNVPADYRQVSGWGADLDPKNRPMVPMELKSDVRTVRGDVKHWQTPRHRILVSNEMPNLTPVFSDACPLHGLSGRLRIMAFEYGEGSPMHWTTLLLADRVDRIECMVGSLLRGRPDNYVREKGWIPRVTRGEPRRQRGLLMAAGAALLMAVSVAAAASSRPSTARMLLARR